MPDSEKSKEAQENRPASLLRPFNKVQFEEAMALSPFPPSPVSLEEKIQFIHNFALNEISRVEEWRVEELKTRWGKVLRTKEIDEELRDEKISLSSRDLNARITYWRELKCKNSDALMQAYKDLLERASYVKTAVHKFLQATEGAGFYKSRIQFLGSKTEGLLQTVVLAMKSQDADTLRLLNPVISSYFDLQAGAYFVRQHGRELVGVANSKEFRENRSQVANAASREGVEILRAMVSGSFSQLPVDEKTTSLNQFLKNHYALISKVLEDYKRIFHVDGTGVHYGKTLKRENIELRIIEWAKQDGSVRVALARILPKCKVLSIKPSNSSGEQSAEGPAAESISVPEA